MHYPLLFKFKAIPFNVRNNVTDDPWMTASLASHEAVTPVEAHARGAVDMSKDACHVH